MVESRAKAPPVSAMLSDRQPYLLKLRFGTVLVSERIFGEENTAQVGVGMETKVETGGCTACLNAQR